MSDCPLVVKVPGSSVAERFDWLRRNKADLSARLLSSGAISFCGLDVDTVERFDALSAVFFDEHLDYVGGDSPRTKLSERVYTSTEFPAQYPISLHNELSYASAWPRQLLFCCTVAAQEGGETPVADSRSILRALESSIVDEFTRRGVRYLRNLHGGSGFGRSWQQTFETGDRTAVERYCAETATQFEWKSDGGLRLIADRTAIATHPTTGESVWFNQADQYHPSTHPKPLYESLLRLYGDDPCEFPTYVTYSDGGHIAPEMLDSIRATVASLTNATPWQRGDALWIDNMLACHGRSAFRGERRVLVAMG